MIQARCVPIRRFIGFFNIILGAIIITVLAFTLLSGGENIFSLIGKQAGREAVGADAAKGEGSATGEGAAEADAGAANPANIVAGAAAGVGEAAGIGTSSAISAAGAASVVRSAAEQGYNNTTAPNINSTSVIWRETKPEARTTAGASSIQQAQAGSKYNSSFQSTSENKKTETASVQTTNSRRTEVTTAGDASAATAESTATASDAQTTQSAADPQTEPAPSAADPQESAATAVTTVTAASATSTVNSKQLEGLTICIDPGHQKKQNSELEKIAPDSNTKKPKVSSGTAGIVTGEAEYALTLAVSLKLKDLLESDGAEVVMTRTVNDVDISNIERAKIGNEAGADLVIRIHADGSTNRDVKGVSMLIPAEKYVGEELAATSKKAGQAVLDAVIAETGAKNRGLSVRDDMTGFNWAETPVILIEMGFMSNPEEDRLLATDDYRAKMAAGLYNGCLSYFSDYKAGGA